MTTSRSLPRELLHLAWPVLIAQAAVMANGVIDTLMAGRLSPIDLAAVGIGASIYATVFVTAMGVLLALTPVVSHHYGAGRYPEIGADVYRPQDPWLPHRPEGRGRIEECREEALLQKVLPQDLIRYGLIPEFIGRLPVVATLHDLDQRALIDLLTTPRNAIIKQYQRMFEYEGVKLRFTDDAMLAIADLAIERKIGARGLRMILEDLMLDLMYDLPSLKKVKECVITREVVVSGEKPIMVIEKAG